MKWNPGTDPTRPPRKYREGEPFDSFAELIEWIDSGGWVYGWNHKRPIHPSVILSQQCNSLLRGYSKFWKAIETDEWQNWQNQVDCDREREELVL